MMNAGTLYETNKTCTSTEAVPSCFQYEFQEEKVVGGVFKF